MKQTPSRGWKRLLLLSLSAYYLSIDFCLGAKLGRGWRECTPRTLLAAKKKAVDPERAAKRKAAAEARALALKRAQEEKEKLQGGPSKATRAAPAPAPVPAPAPPRRVRAPAPARARAPAPARARRGVDPERERKRQAAAEAREVAKKRAAEERRKLQASKKRPSKAQDFTQMTVVEIKEELRKRGLKVSGKKAELIQRLQGKEPAESAKPAETTSQTDESKMKVAELREELRRLQLPTTGLKAQLVERLQEARSSANGTPAVGQKLRGTVRRVSQWGAFVDIGHQRPALVRTSRLAERHVRDPLEVVQLGEEVDVWVYRVAKGGLMGLSMIEYPSSKLQDPVAAFEGISRQKWFKGKVRYSGDRDFFVDVEAPQGGGVQGRLARSAVAYPEKVAKGQELQVRVLEVIANTGTLRLSARPSQ